MKTGEDLNGERLSPGILPEEKTWRSRIGETEDSDMDDGSSILEMCTKWVSYFIDDPWKTNIPNKNA